MATTIKIDDDLWEELNGMKDRDTKTFQEVIRRLIENDKENDKQN